MCRFLWEGKNPTFQVAKLPPVKKVQERKLSFPGHALRAALPGSYSLGACPGKSGVTQERYILVSHTWKQVTVGLATASTGKSKVFKLLNKELAPLVCSCLPPPALTPDLQGSHAPAFTHMAAMWTSRTMVS